MTLRVLHLIAPGGVGGAESVVVAGADALRRVGAEVTVGTIVEARAPERAAAFSARVASRQLDEVTVRASGRVDIAMGCALRRVVEEGRFDVVHVHGYKAAIYAAAAAPRRVVLVATHHGQGGHGPVVELYVRASLLAYRRASVVYAVSDSIREHLLAAGVPVDRVKTRENFLSLTFADLEAAATQAPPEDGTVALVYVGRLSYEKGVDVLLQALAWTSNPDLRLSIVGDGNERQTLERMTRELGLEGRVRFEGWRSDVAQIMRRSHAVVLPSRSEGLPMTIVEALALGRPVIATSVGGVPDVVRDVPGSALVSPEDPAALAAALDSLAAERADRVRAAEEVASTTVERYSAEAWATATLADYESACKLSQRARKA